MLTEENMPKVVPQYIDEAKRRIVKAAIEVLAESGFDNMTIDAVARKIGVTKGAVYWYYPNKNALIQEVLIAIENEIEKLASDPYFRQFDNLELPSVFNRFFFAKEHRKNVLFEVGLLRSPDDNIPEVTPEYVRELLSNLTKGIIRGQKNGIIQAPADMKILVFSLAALNLGVLRGEFYAMLFLGRPKYQRTWFYVMRLILNPKGNNSEMCSAQDNGKRI